MADVEIYTNRGCSACVGAKHYLDSKGVNYTEKKLGKSKKIDSEFSIRTRGAKKIPQIFINNEWIGGYDELISYDKAGELNWRLGLEQKPRVGLFTTIFRFMKGEKY
ncbi:MAG: glutaredoxin [Euryarchaeota archaeon]|nr:glutaredoxin [Euryarchaeota archaeon]